MAPTESFIGPKPFALRAGAHLGLVWLAVNLTPVVYAQEEQPDQPGTVGPTVGEAVATERGPQAGEPQAPGATITGGTPDQQPTAPAGPTASPTPAPSATTGRALMDAVRTAAARQLTPTAPAEDLRLRTLDTSFPAEQPQLDVPEPPRDVVAPPLAPVSPRGPSRRTVVRVIDGVTVLTNVTDAPEEDNAAYASAASPRPSGASGLDIPQSRAAMADPPRDVSVNSNALNPASKSSSSNGLGSWLWVLAGFAALLLIAIGVLLTRPVRKS